MNARIIIAIYLFSSIVISSLSKEYFIRLKFIYQHYFNKNGSPMLSKSPTIIAGGLFLISIIILLLDTNTFLFLLINNMGTIFIDKIWILLTTFGDKVFILVLVFIPFWRSLDLLRALLIAALISFLIVGGMKFLIALARPYEILDPASFHLIGDKLTTYAFPSGHTAGAFAIMGCIGFYFKNNTLILLAIFFASLVGLSRIMLGVHWPMDVLVGAALGWMCAGLSVSLISAHLLRDCHIWNYLTYIIYLLLASYLFWKGSEYDDAYWMVKLISAIGIVVALGALIWLFRGGNKEPVSVTGWLS
ncbi:MAG: phosphatase PAP2 family protein [Cocleimonas sp.]|nr:phosphatase PAP2 family protein [Cocleimonas sp.]